MILYEYNTDVKSFHRRLSSQLQHKLRVAMKCYTIFNFVLNEDKTFTFNAKFRDYRTKITFIPKNDKKEPKTYFGEYSEELYEQGLVKIVIKIHTNK